MKLEPKSNPATQPANSHRSDVAKTHKPATTMAVVDIGTDFVSVWTPGVGIVSEPSIVAVDSAGTVRAFGVEAILAQARRGNHLVIAKPFADRHLPDPTIAEMYLRWLFEKAGFMDDDSIPVFLPILADLPADMPLSRLVADLGGDPVAIHRPVAAAIGLDIASNTASNHMMVELWDGGAEVAVMRGGVVVDSETVHTPGWEQAVEAIDNTLGRVTPAAKGEIREIGIHVHGWAAQRDALTLASMTNVALASPLGSGMTVLTGARLLAESVLPWLAGPPSST